MTHQDTPLSAIHRVLQDERNAIRTGNFDELPDLIARKEVLLDAVYTTDVHDLDTLRQGLQHNQKLIEAAISGLRTAGQRVDQIVAVARKCTTYDRNGQAQHMVNANAALERRA